MSKELWMVLLASGARHRLGAQRGPFLRGTLENMRHLVSAEHTLPVVLHSHLRTCVAALDEVPMENVLIQPRNRGTAPGILLGLLEALEREPEGWIFVVPSYHTVEREKVLRAAMIDALDYARRRPDRVILLGMIPKRHHPANRWITPDQATPGPLGTVGAITPSPEVGMEASLLRSGAMVNSGILVSRSSMLLRLFERAAPELVESFRKYRGHTPDALDALYEKLSPSDFCRHVLEIAPQLLRVFMVPPCGWDPRGSVDAPCRPPVARGRRRAGCDRQSGRLGD